MVVSPSKSSRVSRCWVETVTSMEALWVPAVTVILPVPRAEAVKSPFSSMVPMSPSSAQEKTSWSAFRGRCL